VANKFRFGITLATFSDFWGRGPNLVTKTGLFRDFFPKKRGYKNTQKKLQKNRFFSLFFSENDEKVRFFSKNHFLRKLFKNSAENF